RPAGAGAAALAGGAAAGNRTAVAGRSAGRRAAGPLHAARGVRPAGAGRAAHPGGHQLDALVEVGGADEAAVAAAVVAGQSAVPGVQLPSADLLPQEETHISALAKRKERTFGYFE